MYSAKSEKKSKRLSNVFRLSYLNIFAGKDVNQNCHHKKAYSQLLHICLLVKRILITVVSGLWTSLLMHVCVICDLFNTIVIL